MRVLLVKPKHIGDALILSSVATAIRARFPDAILWALLRQGTESILDGCPAFNRIVTTRPPGDKRGGWPAGKRDLDLLREVRAQRFDVAVDLSHTDRGRFFTAFSGAGKRVGSVTWGRIRPPWTWLLNRLSTVPCVDMHRARTDLVIVEDALGIALGEAPPLVFSRECTSPPPFALPGVQPPGLLMPALAVLHPGTRWKRKQWPEDRWVETGLHLARRGLQIVLSVGPDPEEIALGARLVQAIGHGACSTGGQARWSHLAWLLHRARLFVGVDTAAMHLAAACECPTVALFGPTDPAHWGPWKVASRVVAPTPQELRSIDSSVLIQCITTARVVEACDALLA